MSAAAPRPLGRVLRGSEWGLYAEAQAALQKARADADALREAAATESRADADRLRTETLAQAQADAVTLLAQTSTEVKAQLGAVRMAVAEAIAVGVARVIGQIDMAEAVARAAVHAINELQDRNGIVVRVAPAHVPAVRDRLAGTAVEVIGDTALAEGDCVVQTEAGFVQAGLETQIAALRAALLEAAR